MSTAVIELPLLVESTEDAPNPTSTVNAKAIRCNTCNATPALISISLEAEDDRYCNAPAAIATAVEDANASAAALNSTAVVICFDRCWWFAERAEVRVESRNATSPMKKKTPATTTSGRKILDWSNRARSISCCSISSLLAD
jgi:hypothetical protein